MYSILFRTLVPAALAYVALTGRPAAAADWIVPDDFPKIQDAIDAAAAGDVVKVRAGTYFEALLVTKSITLKAKGDDVVVIDASSVSPPPDAALEVSGAGAAGASIEELEFENSPKYGIHVHATSAVSVLRCIVRDSQDRGLYLTECDGLLVDACKVLTVTLAEKPGIGSIDLTNSVIRGCKVKDTTFVGIRILGSGNLIEDNLVTRAGDDGIQLGYSAGLTCANTVVRGNEVSEVVGSGIYLTVGSNGNTLEDNLVEDANVGIRVDSAENVLTRNTTKQCMEGIGLWNTSADCLLYENKSRKNTLYGIFVDGAGHSLISNVAKKNDGMDAYQLTTGHVSLDNDFASANF